MPKIDNLKTLLNHQISDGRYKLSVYINESNVTSRNAIMIFYNNDNDIIAKPRHTGSGYYNTGLQIVCRHNDYDKARAVALDTWERISKNGKVYQGVYYDTVTMPEYTGVDVETSGHTWSFDIQQKGGA